MKTWCVWAAVAVIPFLGGCGTVGNLKGPPADVRVFGGVRQGWAELTTARYDDVYCINLLFLPLRVVDLPLSVVGDTLTLPYTLFLNSNLLKHRFVYDPSDYEQAAASMNADRPAASRTNTGGDR